MSKTTLTLNYHQKKVQSILKCSPEKAIKIEEVTHGGIIDWSEDSNRLIKGVVKGIAEWDEFKNMN